jgi:hypothetical protein
MFPQDSRKEFAVRRTRKKFWEAVSERLSNNELGGRKFGMHRSQPAAEATPDVLPKLHREML